MKNYTHLHNHILSCSKSELWPQSLYQKAKWDYTLLQSQIYYERTKSSVLVCVKDKRDLHQQKQSLQAQGSDVCPPFSTWKPTAGVVSSFELLSRRETWTHLSKHATRLATELARGWRGGIQGQAERQSRACSAWERRVRGHPAAVYRSLTGRYKDEKAWLISGDSSRLG